MGKYGTAFARRTARAPSWEAALRRGYRALALALAAAVMAAAIPLAAAAINTNDLDYDCAYICSELGILLGEGSGVTPEYLMKVSTRIQAAYLTLRLVGKEGEAELFTSWTDNFNDVGDVYPGGQNRTAYLKAHSAQYGWQGDGTGRLMPDDRLTPQQFYKVLLTVLGYTANVDYNYADTLDFASATADMNECRQFSTLNNDDLAVMMVEALFARVKGQAYTLAEFLAEEGVIDYDRAAELGVILEDGVFEDDTPPETQTPGGLAVSSVAAANFAEIEITFNKKIDPSSVDTNYIKVGDQPLAATDVVTVLPDGVTLRIYRPEGFAAAQGDERTVTISRIRSLDGGELMAAAEGLKATMRDTQSPTLLSAEAQGLRRVKLTFSEPLRVSDAAVKNNSTYRFNTRVYQFADAVEATGREVYLSLSSPLDAGENRLSIDRNRLYDLAGFPIEDVVDLPFYAEEDLTKPAVVDIDAYREKVVVTFSKEIKTQARMYWVDGSAKRYAASLVRDASDRATMTFAFAEGSYLPAGSVDIVIEGITDYNGNTVPDHRATIVPKLDTTRPEVISVESYAAHEIIVEFSKPVKAGTSNNSRFTLRNSSNVSITLGVQSYTPSGASAPDARFIKLTGNIPPGAYTLTVSNVEDTTAQANRSDASTHNVTVRDAAAPVLVSVSTKIAESKVVLEFDKPLDWNSASDIKNYQWNWPSRGHVAMPSGSTATLESNQRTVVVQFPLGGWVVGGNTVVPDAFTLYIATGAAGEMRIMDIMGTNGNYIETQLVDVPSSNEVAAKLEKEAYAVSSTKVTLKFESSGSLPINASASDFVLRVIGGATLPLRAMGASNIDSAKREISIELMDGYAMNANGTYGTANQPLSVSMVMPASVSLTKTALGTPLEIKDSAAASVADNIKPGMLEAFRGSRASQASGAMSGVTYPALTQNQILIVLDERVRLFGVTSSDQLGQMLEIRTESQPGTTLALSAYEVIAYNESNENSTFSSSVETRMLLVTLKTAYSEAVDVTVRSNYLWDGNLDSNAQYVMNQSIDTGYLAPN